MTVHSKKFRVVENRYAFGKYHVLYKKGFFSRWKYIRASHIGLLEDPKHNPIWSWTSEEAAKEFINKNFAKVCY